MRIRILAAITVVVALGGCDRFGAGAPKEKAHAAATAKAKPRKNVNQPVEDAMSQIPPQMRIDYQKAFVCEVKRNNAAKGKAINVTPAYVADLTSRLRAKPELAKC